MTTTNVGEKFNELHLIKYDLFKEQDPETGRFDVIFEVEGKLLFAHINMLTLVSDTFNAWLSDRWSPKKDDTVKIADYRYDDFFQFITFLYTAQCQLTETNIFSMVDIAEFYGIPLFKEYCDDFLSALTITAENVFQLIELADKYSLLQLKASVYGYITKNFQIFSGSDGFLGAKKTVIQEIFTSVKNNVKAEALLQAVYKWCEKQAMNAQNADPTLYLNDQIKTEMSDFLPQFCFDKMELKFLLEFLVPRGFIFSSLNELSKVLCDSHSVTKVKITNGLGQTLHGKLECDNVFIEAIKTLKSSSSVGGREQPTHLVRSVGGTEKASWWKCKNIVSNRSPLKKRDGVEWYLVYYHVERFIIYVHHSVNFSNGCVLAELSAETSDFKATAGSKIEIE